MIYEFGTEQVNQKLCEKEESGYQSNVTERKYGSHCEISKKEAVRSFDSNSLL